MKSLFTGLISTQSRIKRVEEKAAKHQLKVAVIVRDPATKASVNTFYTCNFARHEDLVSYETEFGKAIAHLKEQHAQ